MENTEPLIELKQSSVQYFSASAAGVTRTLTRRDGTVVGNTMPGSAVEPIGDALAHRYDDLRLRAATPLLGRGAELTVADLFSGAGGLSVGVSEAATAVGRRVNHVLAVDAERVALDTYQENFAPQQAHCGPIEQLLDGDIGDKPTPIEKRLAERLDGLDLVVGGPPCQGHSDLNNHTRRSDPRNALYLRMARFAQVVRPLNVIIENVPGVAHDKNGAVRLTTQVLRAMGYSVSSGLVSAARVGGAQARKRHFLVATRVPGNTVDVSQIETDFSVAPRNALDVIRDLDVEPERGIFGTTAQHSATNQTRINYLFDEDVYELPDVLRPDCHRLKKHSYKAVYGRMYPNKPAPTITAGFGSTGQGRFVHPLHPRTLTPHEAARLQGFPDWFTFSSTKRRGELQQMIGNAVPAQLGYAVAASVLR